MKFVYWSVCKLSNWMSQFFVKQTVRQILKMYYVYRHTTIFMCIDELCKSRPFDWNFNSRKCKALLNWLRFDTDKHNVDLLYNVSHIIIFYKGFQLNVRRKNQKINSFFPNTFFVYKNITWLFNAHFLGRFEV